VLIAAIALIAFGAAIVVPIGLSGSLNADGLGKILGRTPPADPTEDAKTKAPERDIASAWASRLRDEEERQRQKAAELEEWEKRLELQQQDLEKQQAYIAEMQTDINAKLDRLDGEENTRLADAAKLIEGMKATGAAESLAAMKPEEAAEIIRRMKPGRNVGKIMDAFTDAEARNRILDELKARPY
jgi:flagellar motility protein MotE (MotC chaperone)